MKLAVDTNILWGELIMDSLLEKVLKKWTLNHT